MDQIRVDDRRKDTRAPISVPVHLQVEGTDEVSDFKACNVSRGGVFLETDSPYPAGTKVAAELFLASLNMKVLANGLVVRSISEPSETDGPAGMAVQFTERGQIGWEFLIDLVESYVAAESS